MQRKFRFSAALGGILLFAAIVAADSWFKALPDRQAAPPAVAALGLEPVEISAAELAPLGLVGAWRLASSDRRFGGVSGLAVDGDQLVAITDAGVVLRFAKQLRRQLPVLVADLPAGPGDPRFKHNRDSEALARDPHGRGWWIAFENRDQLWLYDRGFTRALQRVAIARASLGFNSGIEGLASGLSGIVAFPESGGSAFSWSGGQWAEARLDRRTPLSDAARLEDGSILLLERRLTTSGFSNGLALLRPEGGGFRTVWRKRLPVGRLDNVEAVAAERIAGGGYRLWMMSDDNFHPRLRTLLLVVDVPAALLPKRP